MDDSESLVAPAPLFATAQFIPITSPAAFADGLGSASVITSPSSRGSHSSSLYLVPGSVALERHGEQGLLLPPPPTFSYEQVQQQQHLASALLSPRSHLSDAVIRQDSTLYHKELALVMPNFQPTNAHQGDHHHHHHHHHRESAQSSTAGVQQHSDFTDALDAEHVSSGGAGGIEDRGSLMKSPSTMTNQAPYPFEAGDSRKSPRVFVPRNIEKDVEDKYEDLSTPTERRQLQEIAELRRSAADNEKSMLEQLHKIEHLSSELRTCNLRNDALESDLLAVRLSFDAKAAKLEEAERALDIKTHENSLLSRKSEVLQRRIEELTDEEVNWTSKLNEAMDNSERERERRRELEKKVTTQYRCSENASLQRELVSLKNATHDLRRERDRFETLYHTKYEEHSDLYQEFVRLEKRLSFWGSTCASPTSTRPQTAREQISHKAHAEELSTTLNGFTKASWASSRKKRMNDIAMALGSLHLEDTIYGQDHRQEPTKLIKGADHWDSKAESSYSLPPKVAAAIEKNSSSPRAEVELTGATIPSDDDTNENHTNLLQQKMAAMIKQRDTWENELERISSGSLRQTVETRRRKMHLERLIMDIEADVDQIRFHLRQCSSG